MATDPQTVMIVEDDDQTRIRFANKIRDCPGLEVIQLAKSCSEAITVLKDWSPDVLLVDLGLPDGDGAQIIQFASQLPNHIAIMVITVFGDETRVMRAIRSGASGYLLKTDESKDLCESIHELLEGGAPISPVIARYLIRHFHHDTDTTPQTTPNTEVVLSGV